MKKLLAILLSVIMALSLPLTVLAANGPMGSVSFGDGESIYLSYISLIEIADDGSLLNTNPVFDGEKSYDTINGISYDKASNTLSLNNYNSSAVIETNVMGDDFKINVVGNCSVGQIEVWGDNYGGSLTIEGSGTLTVNKNKRYDNAIVINAEQSNSILNFGKNVKVNLYAQEDVVYITATSSTDASTAITFGNGQTANVSKEPYVVSYGETVNGLSLSDPEYKSYGGEKAVCASDPGGIYTISTGYRESDPEKTLYWVNKYFYVEPFDAYVEDYGFGDFGSIEMTEEEFKDQTEYSIILKQADYPDNVNYYEKDNLDADYYYSVDKLTNASDPNGVYGFSTYHLTDSDGAVIEEGVYINRFVLADGTDKYIVDESFKQLQLTNEEFKNSDYSIVYAMESEMLEWNGYINRNSFDVFTDEKSNKYAVDYNGTVYDYVGKDIVNVGGTDYYCVTENDTVSSDSLKKSIIEKTVEGYYNYTLKGTSFIYEGTSAAHTTHIYDSGKVTKAATCTATGVKTYTCTVCGATKTETIAKKAHTYKNYVTKATMSANGSIVNKCSVCGAKKSTTTIYKISSVALSTYACYYTGSVKTPSVTVKDSKGKVLKKGTDYDVTYASGRKNVGRYAVTIKFKGNYSGTKTLYFNIIPKGTSISKVTATSKGFKVQWKTQKTQTTGYQIQYSTSSKFSNAKTITMPKNTYSAKSITKLLGKKKYYVRIRTYKVTKFGGKNYNIYSPWSSAKSVTTKK